jgi:hypothetical protein
VFKVLSASWSPCIGFGIDALEVGADALLSSFSSIIGIRVIRETYELSSSSQILITSKRVLGTPVSPGVLGISCWVGMVTNNLAFGDGTLGFSRPMVSSNGVDSEPFSSSLTFLGSARVILIVSNS